MRIAGVRADKRTVWLDAGSHQLHPWDRVLLDWDGSDAEGRVVVCPEQFVRPPESIEGAIRGVVPFEAQRSFICGDRLSELPPLGSTAWTRDGSGTVIGIDPVRQTVTVETYEQGVIQVALDELAPSSVESPQPVEQRSSFPVLSDD